MITDKVSKLAEPLVENMGYMFWGVEYLSSEALLRVYIDAEDGINVDDCAAVSRELSVLLDVEDIVPNRYRLEISSPGMRRPFFKLAQYPLFIGHEIKLKLRFPFEGRRNFRGLLSSVDEQNAELGIAIGDEEFILPYEQVEKASLIANFESTDQDES